ncbi:universal stress protein [Microbispora sp. RL4-1S]|uniref:Universal stress protein n=1 Tax=Microbispora oryzae TaxID=2806554 RepID=A0A941AJK5_9ACTN|nr:universal stress protein [Microbispora oryzae]MBP2705087.1 universal stress protein [Microbispora oryzae]
MSDHEQALDQGRDQVRPVLVGYDGSPAGEAALRWAVEEARLRGAPLTVCHAWCWSYPFRPPDEKTLEVLRCLGAMVADEGVRKAHSFAEGLEVRWHLKRGWPAAVLLEASRDADLVVLGSRGHAGFDDVMVGSTAVQVPARGDRPVVVVRSAERQPVETRGSRGEGPSEGQGERRGARVVVGVDGSPASEAALGFALAEAELRDGRVEAVCGWWDPGVLPGPERLPFVRPETLRAEAIERFEHAVAGWKAEHPKVPIETRFVVETPRRALLDAAKDADLLVVGSRGIGSSPKLLLGPVTQTALHEAPCPVAVVPPARP